MFPCTMFIGTRCISVVQSLLYLGICYFPGSLQCNSRCCCKETSSTTEQTLFFYPHYIREISKVVYKKTSTKLDVIICTQRAHAAQHVAQHAFVINAGILYRLFLTTSPDRVVLQKNCRFPRCMGKKIQNFVQSEVAFQQHLPLVILVILSSCAGKCNFPMDLLLFKQAQ